MKITPEELKASYRRMSDEELLELDRGQLTDVARGCYDKEMERRGLEAGGVPETHEDAAPPLDDEPLVVVENCASSDEAWALQSMLEGAGIPARIGDDRVRAANWPNAEIGRFPVAVPASCAEQARQVLSAQAPEAIVVAARYENGVFVPVEKMDLLEGTMVEVHVPPGALGAED